MKARIDGTVIAVLTLLFGGIIAANARAGGEQGTSRPSTTGPATLTTKSPQVDARESWPGKYWEDRERGWFWYEDPFLESENKLPETHPVVPKDARAPELVEMEKLQEEVANLRKIAIIRPTEKNVRRYMELEAKVYALAGRFADMTQRVAWATPSLDPSWQGRPTSKVGLEVYEQQKRTSHDDRLRELASTHVLFFFFRSDCPYCHAYAPLLARFEANYGIKVVPISLDGQGLPEYPNPRTDNGIAKTLNVTTVPTTFIAAPTEGSIMAVGAGVLSDSELIERIVKVTSPEMRRDVPGAVRQLTLE